MVNFANLFCLSWPNFPQSDFSMLSALLNQGGWMAHCPNWTCNQSHFHPRHLAVSSIFSADTCVKGPGLWRPGLEEGAMHRCLLTEILCSPESVERFLRMMVEKDTTIGTFLCLVSFCTSMYSAGSTDQGGRPGMTWLTPRVSSTLCEVMCPSHSFLPFGS